MSKIAFVIEVYNFKSRFSHNLSSVIFSFLYLFVVQGDRGSPVVCDRGGDWALVGVVGQEVTCHTSHAHSSVMTFLSIAHHIKWIEKIQNVF